MPLSQEAIQPIDNSTFVAAPGMEDGTAVLDSSKPSKETATRFYRCSSMTVTLLCRKS